MVRRKKTKTEMVIIGVGAVETVHVGEGPHLLQVGGISGGIVFVDSGLVGKDLQLLRWAENKMPPLTMLGGIFGP